MNHIYLFFTLIFIDIRPVISGIFTTIFVLIISWVIYSNNIEDDKELTSSEKELKKESTFDIGVIILLLSILCNIGRIYYDSLEGFKDGTTSILSCSDVVRSNPEYFSTEELNSIKKGDYCIYNAYDGYIRSISKGSYDILKSKIDKQKQLEKEIEINREEKIKSLTE